MPTERLGRTLYESVADNLRERILRSEWTPGERLISEPLLAAEFKVSRATVRKAIAILAKEGLLVVSHGLGTFVQFARARQTLGRLETLEATLIAEGFEPTSKIIDFAFVAPSGGAKEALQLEEGSRVLHIRRLHSVSDGPMAVVDLDVAEETGVRWSRSDVEQYPLYDLLARSGTHVEKALQIVRAAPAPEEIALLLGIPTGAPVLIGERVTMSDKDQPIVKATFTFRHDRFEYRISTDANVPVFPWPRSESGVAPAYSPLAEEGIND
jgi:GntR family transcriptional regulator